LGKTAGHLAPPAKREKLTAPPKLGQHFLIKGSVLERIAAAACPEPEPLVIEIGPGRGALTEKLLRRAGRVIAIELDGALVEHLQRKFAGEERLTLIHRNVLETDLEKWSPAVIAGNLPYYITSPILEKVLRAPFRRAVFLVQKEVAERLAARPGGRDYGFLTLRTALRAEPQVLFGVKPSAFRPPPKVDSAVVALQPRNRLPDVRNQDAFLRFVSQCFRHKRKTIRNNLTGLYPKEEISRWPEGARRAEELSIEEFAAMYRRVAES
jgi:16S rRNA (adenine1518-N6/adenine1519-N6)-dimethyltransferase